MFQHVHSIIPVFPLVLLSLHSSIIHTHTIILSLFSFRSSHEREYEGRCIHLSVCVYRGVVWWHVCVYRCDCAIDHSYLLNCIPVCCTLSVLSLYPILAPLLFCLWCGLYVFPILVRYHVCMLRLWILDIHAEVRMCRGI